MEAYETIIRQQKLGYWVKKGGNLFCRMVCHKSVLAVAAALGPLTPCNRGGFNPNTLPQENVDPIVILHLTFHLILSFVTKIR